MALGLRVVTVEGAPIRFRHALVRALVGLVELYLTLGTLALLVAMGSRRFRRLGDHLAGTVVVQERSGTAEAQAIRFLPRPGWESFADALDVSRLTAEHYRLVRSYLLRASALDFTTRWRLGNEILDVVAGTTAMSPDVRRSLLHSEPTAGVDRGGAAAFQRRFSPDPVFLQWLPLRSAVRGPTGRRLPAGPAGVSTRPPRPARTPGPPTPLRRVGTRHRRPSPRLRPGTNRTG